ncbi:MAG: rRNA maturation RNase YbeY [Calditrichaeota bacterium]|nr:rRNA maturation RNase YbeY [Calditrichota bacterium]
MTIEIDFYNKYGKLTELSHSYLSLINLVIDQEKMDCKSVTVIWVNDADLAKLHADFLDDPSKTDVMTFDLGDEQIEAEIYISVDRAIEQAKQFKVDLSNELSRLVVHGLLHLAGYDDHTDTDIKAMRQREEHFLKQIN